MEVKWELKMGSEVKLMAMVEILLMVQEILLVVVVEILLMAAAEGDEFLEVVGAFSFYLEVVVIEGATVFLDSEVLMAEIQSFYDYMVMVDLRDHEVD
jgi:uncharacterized membrane protein